MGIFTDRVENMFGLGFKTAIRGTSFYQRGNELILRNEDEMPVARDLIKKEILDENRNIADNFDDTHSLPYSELSEVEEVANILIKHGHLVNETLDR